jgi:hypothetical protein
VLENDCKNNTACGTHGGQAPEEDFIRAVPGEEACEVSGPFDSKTPDIIAAGETLRPLRDGILLEPLDWQPSHVIDLVRFGRPLRGIVRAVGPGVYAKRYLKNAEGQRCAVRDTAAFIPTQVKPCDIVELGGLNIFDGQGYQFQDVMLNGKTYLLCREADVCGVADAESHR